MLAHVTVRRVGNKASRGVIKMIADQMSHQPRSNKLSPLKPCDQFGRDEDDLDKHVGRRGNTSALAWQPHSHGIKR